VWVTWMCRGFVWAVTDTLLCVPWQVHQGSMHGFRPSHAINAWWCVRLSCLGRLSCGCGFLRGVGVKEPGCSSAVAKDGLVTSAPVLVWQEDGQPVSKAAHRGVAAHHWLVCLGRG
jgi:hypothetical protein